MVHGVAESDMTKRLSTAKHGQVSVQTSPGGCAQRGKHNIKDRQTQESPHK